MSLHFGFVFISVVFTLKQSIVRKKMATGTFTHNSYRAKILKPLIKMHRKGLKTSNLAYTILLVQGCISPKYGFLRVLMVPLGSQGIVVKCTAAIFFRTVDFRHVISVL